MEPQSRSNPFRTPPGTPVFRITTRTGPSGSVLNPDRSRVTREPLLTLLMVYVDDHVLIGDLESVPSMKKKLNIRFEMSDLGPLSYFLGIAVTRDEIRLYLSQERYAEPILAQFQFTSLSRYEAQNRILSSSLPTWCYSLSKNHWFDHIPDAGYQARPLICSGSSHSVVQFSQCWPSCSPASHSHVYTIISTPATAPNEVFCIRSHY